LELDVFAFWTNRDLLDDRPKFDVESLEEESIDKARVYVRGILRKPAIQPDSEKILKAGLSPYTKFIPPKPAMAGYTEAYHIQDLVEWIDDDWPVDIEPKYNGFRVICERKGDKLRMWMEGTYGKDHLHKFPDLANTLKAIPGDWIFDADLGIERKGRRLPRPALATLNTDRPVLEKGDVVVLTIFDCPYYNEDLHGRPLQDRRKVLERIFAKYAKDPLRISPVGIL
jgi:ATP-dependent DNA ligase